MGVCHHAQVYEVLRIKRSARYTGALPTYLHHSTLPFFGYFVDGVTAKDQKFIWMQCATLDAFVIPSVLIPFITVFPIHTYTYVYHTHKHTLCMFWQRKITYICEVRCRFSNTGVHCFTLTSWYNIHLLKHWSTLCGKSIRCLPRFLASHFPFTISSLQEQSHQFSSIPKSLLPTSFFLFHVLALGLSEWRFACCSCLCSHTLRYCFRPSYVCPMRRFRMHVCNPDETRLCYYAKWCVCLCVSLCVCCMIDLFTLFYM